MKVRSGLGSLTMSIILSAACMSAQVQQARPDLAFQGRYLVVASDTDMLPSAYTDGVLGPFVGPDELSIIQLHQPLGAMTTTTTAVSNSVIGPPSSIALTTDGRYAAVVETRGQRTDRRPDAKSTNLSTGRQITVIDLSDPSHPRVTQRLDSYDDPLSITFNASGTLACVAFKQVGPILHPLLALYRFHEGKLSHPIIPRLPGMEGGDALISAEFHPKQNLLGLLYTQHPRLQMVQVNDEGKDIELEPWGGPVDIDMSPFLVRFTPDGRFAFVNAMLPGAVRGTVTSIQLAKTIQADGTPMHAMISRANAGILPEGLTISPNERWVVTTNLERSTPALDSPEQGHFASVTLLRFDKEAGLLERVGDYPFDGRLPEAAVFDNTSQFLAVACFAHYDPAKPGGAIDFWRVVGDAEDPSRAALVKLDFSVPVARGPQSMVLAR